MRNLRAPVPGHLALRVEGDDTDDPTDPAGSEQIVKKPRVTRTMRVEIYPSARCDYEGCEWIHWASPNGRSAGKDHAQYNPGHVVIVEVVKRDAYQLVGT